MRALTPAKAAAAVLIVDDDLENTATLHSEQVFEPRPRGSLYERSDAFIRALIDKRTGATRYQLYAELRYYLSWRNFYAAAYADEAGPQDVPLKAIARDVGNCSSSCEYVEVVAFDIPEERMRKIGEQYDAAEFRPWRFRFKARNGFALDDQISPAEVAGILIRVGRYRSERGWIKAN